jgi:hypothetical protein
MVYVFKTNLLDQQDVARVSHCLNRFSAVWSVDTEDEDRVLRLETDTEIDELSLRIELLDLDCITFELD